VERDDKFLRGTIKARPELADCPLTINESLVVELYALSL
jgi:ribosomal protein S4